MSWCRALKKRPAFRITARWLYLNRNGINVNVAQSPTSSMADQSLPKAKLKTFIVFADQERKEEMNSKCLIFSVQERINWIVEVIKLRQIPTIISLLDDQKLSYYAAFALGNLSMHSGSSAAIATLTTAR